MNEYLKTFIFGMALANSIVMAGLLGLGLFRKVCLTFPFNEQFIEFPLSVLALILLAWYVMEEG